MKNAEGRVSNHAFGESHLKNVKSPHMSKMFLLSHHKGAKEKKDGAFPDSAPRIRKVRTRQRHHSILLDDIKRVSFSSNVFLLDCLSFLLPPTFPFRGTYTEAFMERSVVGGVEALTRRRGQKWSWHCLGTGLLFSSPFLNMVKLSLAAKEQNHKICQAK